MLPAAFVTNEISPKMMFVPAFISMAVASESMIMTGSIHASVVKISISIVNSTPMMVTMMISLTELVVAMAVFTAEPVMAASSPIISLIASVEAIALSSFTAMFISAEPSL